MTCGKCIVDCVSPEMQAKRGEIEPQPFLTMLVAKRPLSCKSMCIPQERL
jgi:hypothetical protein